MKYSRLWFASASFFLLPVVLFVSCRHKSGHVQDEAMLADRNAASLPAADEDYFHDMDGGLTLTADEVKGRNTWNVWSGGNDRFWDGISKTSFGNLDLLKTISSYPKLKFSRDNRWNYLGLVNEPCFDKATGPDASRFGLWLDKRRSDCPADPFENESKYPGNKNRSPRQEHARRIALRLRDRNSRFASFPEPGFRRSGGQEMGSQTVL